MNQYNPSTDGASLAVADGGKGRTPPDSLWELVTKSVRAHPNNSAVIVLYQLSDHLSELLEARNEKHKAGEHLDWSYKQLQSAAVGLAEALKAQNVQQGDVFVSFIANSIEYAICYWAAVRLNVTFAPLDPALLGRLEDLQIELNLLRPRVVAANNSIDATKIDELESNLLIKLVLADDDTLKEKHWYHFPKFILDHPENHGPLDAAEAEKHAGMTTYPIDVLFTSGTTSRPKACAHNLGSLVAGIMDRAPSLNLTPTSRFLVQTSNFRIICPRMCFCCWISGAAVVFPSLQFDPAAIMRAVISEKCTNLLLVPAHVFALERQHDLVKQLKLNNHLQYVGVGGDIVTTQIIDKIRETLCPARAVPGFGMSEGGGQIGWAGDALRDGKIPTTDGSVVSLGFIRPGTKIRICKEGTRMPVKRGENGALHLNGQMAPYLEDRDPESFYNDDQGSWFITGDIAMMDDSGAIFVLGRIKDIIKRKGVGLSPAVIESSLHKHPGILASVIAMPHEEYGQVPVAVIHTSDSSPALKATLKERVNSELGADSAIEDIFSLEDLGLTEFPLNSTGKIMKRDLQQVVGDYYRRQQQNGTI